ncbi:MAG: peptide chain release factor 2 [Erysipelotrichaceae bacterium]
MELYELKQQVDFYCDRLNQFEAQLELETKKKRIQALEEHMLEPSFWSDRKESQKTINEKNALVSIVDGFTTLSSGFQELFESCAILKEEFDDAMMELCVEEYEHLKEVFESYEVQILLSHEYDHASAILEIHPGAGGTESQDWAEMLYRLYSRWAQAHDYKVSIIDYQDGDEAGIKSVSLLIEGDMAYGYLKAEKGVHRLVRISPFDSSGRRHTSFASVDIMPQFNDEVEINLDPNDLVIETHRASGAGGQHVNKTDSAVRITHRPTGLVANCQNGRSQHDNKESALNVIKSKLYQRMIEEQEAKLAEIKGEQKAIEWGSQIRSYVFHPYSLVKDLRTNYETNNVQAVMDGKIDAFIFAYLKTLIQ